MPPCAFRKHKSGAEKRRKKKKDEEFVKSQTGALLKFVKRGEQLPIDNDNVGINNNEIDEDVIDNVNEEVIETVNEEIIETINEEIDEEVIENVNEENGQNENSNEEDRIVNIYDPENWEKVDQNLRDLLVEKGPIRNTNTNYFFPMDSGGRHFSYKYYTRKMKNGERQDRRWLVYSETLDKVFYFCCKLFKQDKDTTSNLTTSGFNNWGNLSGRLKQHETSHEHIKCMSSWIELELRLKKNETFDKNVQDQVNKEKEHWREVLMRIFSVVKTLAKNNLAFRGNNEKIGQENNGNFLSIIEMIAEFDPVMREHLRRIANHDFAGKTARRIIFRS